MGYLTKSSLTTAPYLQQLSNVFARYLDLSVSGQFFWGVKYRRPQASIR